MIKDQEAFKFTPMVIAIPLYFVLTLWVVYFIEIKFQINLTKYGLYPKTFKGLRGILFSPFIHSGTKHLFNNSVPLFVLLTALFYFYRKVAFKVLIYGTLLLGLITWFIGRSSYHIGASGIVYLLFSFVFFSGLFTKYYRLTAVSLIVIFLYGGMIWYVFPTKEEISWEGHLSGLIAGIFFAILYRKYGPVKGKFAWEKEGYVKDDFDNQFDENGNYIPPPPIERKEIKASVTDPFQVNYIYNKEEE